MNYKLRDIVSFKPGYAFKKDEMSDCGFPLIKIKSIKNNKVVLDPDSNINKSAAKKGYEIRNGDILMALTGDPVTKGSIETWAGRSGIYENNEMSFLNQRVCKIIPNEAVLDNKYLYYWLIRPEKTFEIASLYHGSANQANISHKDVGELQIDLPDIRTQKKISTILSNIDEKILINNRTNDNLFKVAQAIYDDWFIKFNYPESNGEFIESELGPIPKGWSIGFVDDKKLTIIAKSGVETYSGKKSYVATADVSGRQISGSILLSFDERPSRANMQPVAGSVWFAKMENSVKNILVTEYMERIYDKYIFSTGFMGLECLNGSTYYIWNYINSKTFEEIKNNLSTGTLMAGISNSTIKSAQYVIPPQDLLDKFNLRVDGIFRTIYNNELENERLTKLRDTLLPELLNGKIDVSNIDI